MKRKGQIQTLETVAVLFVFFILVAMSIIFIGTYQKGKTSEAVHAIFQRQAARIAESLTNIPEFRATIRGVKGVNTFDIVKMNAFKETIANNEDLELGIYRDKFGSSRIIVHQIYPFLQDYEIYNAMPNLEDYDGDRYSYFIPVSLYNPLDSSLTYGMIEVQYYAE